jgi:hypothetical protein
MEEALILEKMDLLEALLKKDMNEKFTIEICSDLDYEEMVADVSYENRTIAMITQENGIDSMEIEIFPPEKEIKSWKLPLDDFINIVFFAKKCLIEEQKSPRE